MNNKEKRTMATTGKIHKVVWRNIPAHGTGFTWHQHLLGTFVIDPNGNLTKSEICTKAVEQVIGGIYNTREWMECRGPFTYFNPELSTQEEEKVLAAREERMTLSEYLMTTEPIVQEVTNIVVISSSLDG